MSDTERTLLLLVAGTVAAALLIDHVARMRAAEDSLLAEVRERSPEVVRRAEAIVREAVGGSDE